MVFSAPTPTWGPPPPEGDLRAPPPPHVPCSQSGVSVTPCPWGWMPRLGTAPPHTDPFAEALGVVGAVLRWLPWAHTASLRPGCSPVPSQRATLSPEPGRRGLCYRGCRWSGATSEPACQRARCLFVQPGGRGRPPSLPAPGETGVATEVPVARDPGFTPSLPQRVLQKCLAALQTDCLASSPALIRSSPALSGPQFPLWVWGLEQMGL